MKRKGNLIVIMMCIFIIKTSQDVYAKDFCVCNGEELKSALKESSVNKALLNTIKIVNNTYVGNFDYTSVNGSSLTIEGGYTKDCQEIEPSQGKTVLDGNKSGRVLNINISAFSDVIIRSLTITNGLATQSGGGLFVLTKQKVLLSKLDIKNNKVIPARWASTSGGGAKITAASVIIDKIKVQNNVLPANGIQLLEAMGSGLRLDVSDTLLVTNSLISQNTGGQGYLCQGGGVFISTSIPAHIAGPTGGGIMTIIIPRFSSLIEKLFNISEAYAATIVKKTYVTLLNNTIVENTALGGKKENFACGGGLYLWLQQKDVVTIANNIIYGNKLISDRGKDIFIKNYDKKSPKLMIDSNDFDISSAKYGYQQDLASSIFDYNLWTRNFDDVDPDFMDSVNYRLSNSSILRDKGNNSNYSFMSTANIDYSKDLDGKSRIISSVIDVGAYEME